MDVADNGIARSLGIENYFNKGYFECVVKPGPLTGRWITLATSKYGDPVGGIIAPSKEDEQAGLIFIFPQLECRSDLVIDLMDRVLPELRPRLFPHAEGSRWTRRPEYDLPRVTALKRQIIEIETETRTRVSELEEQIEVERSAHGFMPDLLTATGDDLVQAVVQALSALGFNDVRDADVEAKAAGAAGQLREDLRIMDAAVPVLVEIKGLAGMPKEANSLQVAKYLAPRMREWRCHDLRGLSIVNHQRNLPALERDHEHVFQADVVITQNSRALAC